MPKFDVTTDDKGEQHVRYTCPGCKHEHTVPAKRWNWNGSVDKPTLSPSVRHFYTKISPETGKSIEVTTCHNHVKNGVIEYCGDCQHSFSGTKVELPNCLGTEFDESTN